MIERAEGIYLFDAGAALPRRRRLAVVQRPRPPAPGDRRGAAGAARPGRAHDDARASPTGRPSSWPRGWSSSRRQGSTRVFFSDTGSTAVEIALKMAFQYWQQRGGEARRRTWFLALGGAYHGDTLGAVWVGGIDPFHAISGRCLFRRPSRSQPGGRRRARAGARRARASEIAAVVVEPLVQGAAGMIVQPPGFLRAVREL